MPNRWRLNLREATTAIKRRILVDIRGPKCPNKGSIKILKLLQDAIAKHGLGRKISAVGRSCFGLCSLAPNLYLEPEGIWYSRLKVSDVDEIVEKTVLKGEIVQRLIQYGPGKIKQTKTKRKR